MTGRTIEQLFEGSTLAHEHFGVDQGPQATILLFPTVMGVTDLERGFARRLVDLGYAVLLVDLYGRHFGPAQRDEAFAAMGALRGDRAALRARLIAVLEHAGSQSEIDGQRLAAIGFCFGGQCVLDLARSGVDIAGVASFHGLFDPPGLEPLPIKARVAAFHGWDDPLVPPEAVVSLGAELTAAGRDWQIHAYGHVGHGFTNPGATGSSPGIRFDEQAAHRAWRSCDDFLTDLFG